MSAGRLHPAGTLGPDDLYIPRFADEQLEQSVRNGEFCYVGGPRQNGKSSIVARLIHRLGADTSIAAVKLDVSGRALHDRAACFRQLASDAASKFRLPPEEENYWWEQQAEPDPLERWFSFLFYLVAHRVGRRILIVLDEIDTLLPDGDLYQQLLERIRRAYLEREQLIPEQNLVDFCPVGAFPNALTFGKIWRTPFNLGKVVLADDFDRTQFQAFLLPITELQGDEQSAREILDEIWGWTEGHPSVSYGLVYQICEERRRPIGRVRREMDEIVGQLFLQNVVSPPSVFTVAAARMVEDEPGASASNKLECYERSLAVGVLDPRPDSGVELAVRMAGLAALRSRPSGPQITLRNHLFERRFDDGWLFKARQGVQSSDRTIPSDPEDNSEDDTIVEVREVVDSIFEMEHTSSEYERTGPGEVLIPGLLYRFPVLVRGAGPAALQVFRQVRDLGGLLWQQETRVLTRLSSSLESTLPQILAGGFLEEHQLAFTLTRSSANTLADEGAIERLREDPATALREIWRLVDGLYHYT